MRLSPAYELKRASVEGAGRFEGYASTFNGPADSYGDVIAPGAFAASLAAHKAAGTAPVMLWQHDTAEPIGRWIDLREDSHGLRVVGQLTLETQRGAEALALLKANALNGLSIGFMVPDDGAVMSGRQRTITKADLVEVSIVSLPANSAARVVQVKSIREFEESLRDAGFPKAAARKLAAGGWPALGGATPDDAGMRELVTLAHKRRAELQTIIRGFSSDRSVRSTQQLPRRNGGGIHQPGRAGRRPGADR